MIIDEGRLPLTTDAFTAFLLMTITSGFCIIASEAYGLYFFYRMLRPPVDWKKTFLEICGRVMG